MHWYDTHLFVAHRLFAKVGEQSIQLIHQWMAPSIPMARGYCKLQMLYNITHCPESSVYDSLCQYNGITYMYYIHACPIVLAQNCVYCPIKMCVCSSLIVLVLVMSREITSTSQD